MIETRAQPRRGAHWTAVTLMIGAIWLCLVAPVFLWEANGDMVLKLPVTVESELPCPNVPIDPVIDFDALIRDAGLTGVLDPNSIVVISLATGDVVPHALSPDFGHGNRGRVQWVAQDPEHKAYEIRFSTADTRPALRPAAYTPPIGTGDLLRYNAGVPRPISLIYLSRLVDLTGDGKLDLVGCWNYAHEPGCPWDSIFCFPRVGDDDAFEFGDPVRLRYVEEAGSRDYKTPSRIYMHADIVDLNGDGLPDIVYSPSGDNNLYLFLNSGERDDGGMPIFVAEGKLPRGTSQWGPCRVVDLDGDGALDVVVGNTYLRNMNEDGWPPAPAAPVTLDCGSDACFYDVDGDGLPDAVCLIDGPVGEPRAKRVAWRRNLGGDPPTFGPPQVLEEIDDFWCNYLGIVPDGPRRGLLVGHEVYQQVSFYEQTQSGGEPRFRKFGRAESISAVLSLSDQAWPCGCDWDGDGDLDLLVGGGYGWPRIVINEGTRERPVFAEAKVIEAAGEPIRLLRDDIFGGEHWHNMGYPYPVFVDWDDDGLPDLIVPNETDRIFWYKNIGTREEPKFGERRQIICDGYPDSAESRARSAALSADKAVPNNPYPYQEDQPFFWRTGAGFADLNGDGLMDMVTHDGHTRKLTLFVQYRDGEGNLRLRKDAPLKLADGRLIDDVLVARAAHWTESFRCVDWDGDGLTDIVYSCAGQTPAKGSIYLLRNCGTATEPVFEAPVTLCCFGKPIHVTSHGPHPWVGDFSGDGRPDVVPCVEWSVYPFYGHAAMTMGDRPRLAIGKLKTN